MKTLLLLLLNIFLLSVPMFPQGTVRGVVRDSITNEPLRSVIVRVDSMKKGVLTNRNGEYQLRLASGNYTLVFSMIGRKTERRPISLKDSLRVDVHMHEAATLVAGVTVIAEDPGVRLMRKCIERKKKQVDSLKSYSYMLYTKFDASTDTITAGRTSGRGDTTIISIFESYSKGYYAKPDKYYNEIVQRRQTANIPPEANIVTFGTNLNAYDDYISFFNEQVASPFHPDALDYYDFVQEKTMDEGDSLILTRVKVIPKGNGRKLFEGFVDIDEKNLVPVNISLTPNRAVQLPFDATILYEQSFQRYGWFLMPSSMRIQSNVQVHLFWVINPRLDLNIETLAYDFEINTQIDDELFEQRRTEVNRAAEKFDTVFWNERSVMALRPEEAKAYKQIEESLENQDSTVAAGLFDQIFGWIPRTLAKLNRRPFTGIEDMFRYNRIHGVYLGVGVLDTLSERWEGLAKVGYGTVDKHWYGEAGMRYYLDSIRKYLVSITGYRRLARRDNPYAVQQLGNTILSMLNKSDYGDYYYNNGVEASIEAGFGQLRFIRRDIFARPSNIKIFFRREYHDTAFTNAEWSLLSRSRNFRFNPPVQRGTMQSVGFEAGYNYSPYRRVANFGIGLNVEHASPFIGSTDFNFTAVTAALNLRTRTLPLWRLDARIAAGYIQGNAPPQRFFSLESSVSGFASDAVFRGMNVKEFYGDKFVALSLEHSFGEVIPGVLRIPNIASFGIEFMALGRVGWSEFSPQTLERTQTLLPSIAATKDKIYYELGLGINRLLIFFRLDISARMTQRNNPQFMFTVSGATP